MGLMKKTLALLFMLIMIVGACEAATKEDVYNGEEVIKIQSLAIAYPNYIQTLETEPSINEFINVILEASKASKLTIVPYDDMASKIKQNTGLDIKVLPKKDAQKIFKENVYKYVNAYVSFTLANNSRLNMFCEVYAANTHELLYVLRVEGGKSNEVKNARTYKEMAVEFYKAFDSAIQTEIKKKEKEEKDKEKEEKKAKKKENKK